MLKRYLFQPVERSETCLKLLEVYPEIFQKSRKMGGEFLESHARESTNGARGRLRRPRALLAASPVPIQNVARTSLLLFASPHKRADKLPLKLVSFGVGKRGQRCTCATGGYVGDGIAARHFDFDIDEACCAQEAAIGVFFESASDAPGPGFQVGAYLLREVAQKHHVRDSKAPAGSQYTVRLAQHLPLIGGEVDHAVGDHHINRVLRQRDRLDNSFEKAHVFYSR